MNLKYYYDQENFKLLHGDSLKILKKFPLQTSAKKQVFPVWRFTATFFPKKNFSNTL